MQYVNITYCDIESTTDPHGTELIYENVIHEDPLFICPLDRIYNLKENSPCIDTGNPDSQYDDPDGSQSDIGAFLFLD